MSKNNFICKYCSHHSTLSESNLYSTWETVYTNKSTYGNIGYRVAIITCPNLDCQKATIGFNPTEALEDQFRNRKEGRVYKYWKLLPESESKVFPDYIPVAIREDYYEACKIRDLSPKASATLSRRCLQGMIRDFFGVSKGTLKQEIDAIEDLVDSDVFAAINAVRSVGNIGAHMEKDINVIVDVESNEAQLLIELIEQLIEDWYISRKSKLDRLAKITELAKIKQVSKNKEILE